jgi:hypothetical protein
LWWVLSAIFRKLQGCRLPLYERQSAPFVEMVGDFAHAIEIFITTAIDNLGVQAYVPRPRKQ